mmetsp:Transcript_28546/g.59461  ORF Transcript_28546/g.59461 Transcript_28546/m.59461 type:complete len:629 (-) Transcript_28546:52-1938(-)
MVETVKKSTFLYKTDLFKKATRQDHPSGILHAVRSTASFLAPKEEQCFAWIANPNGRYVGKEQMTTNSSSKDCISCKIDDDCNNGEHDNDSNGTDFNGNDDGNDDTNNHATEDETSFENVERNTHLRATLAHLERFGFLAENVKFIPFSSKANWIYKYPHAYPYIECNEVGEVTGFPYWNPSTSTELCNPTGSTFHLSLGMGRDAFQDDPTKHFLDRSVEKPSAIAGNDNIRTDIAAAATATAVAAAASTANAANDLTSEKRGKSILRAAMLSDKEREQLHLEIYDYFQWLESELTQLESTHDGRRTTANAGLVVSGLRNVVARMEGTFRVIRERDDVEKEASETGSGAPFLEEVLGSALRQRYRRLQPTKRSGHSRAALDFEDMFARLLAFRQEFGHVNVSRKYKKDPQLGIWVSNLKCKKKEYDKAMKENSASTRPRKSSALLDQDKIQRLEAIGFNFETRDVNVIPWEARLESLKEYHQQNGTFRVPRRHGSLGEWVHKQRQLYNKRDEKFMEKRYPKLEAIGFEFTTNRTDLKTWDHRFEELVAFHRVNGHFDVPCPPSAGECDENDPEMEQYRLHKWVNRQRAEYRAYASGQNTRLSDDRIVRLNEIGFNLVHEISRSEFEAR